MASPPDISPSAQPFDAFVREREAVSPAPVESGLTALDCVAMAKRILLQERVRDFTAADVVALASIIEARDRQFKLATKKQA